MHRSALGTAGGERLGRFEFFAMLSPGQRNMLGRILDELTAEAGEDLVTEGELGHDVAFIEEGTAEVLEEGTVINTIGPGDLYGELAVLGDGVPRTATVRASAPIRAILFTSNAMHTVRERMPDVGAAIEQAAEEHRERDRARAAGTT